MPDQAKLSVGVLGGGVMAYTHVRSLLAMPGVELCGLSAPVVGAELEQVCQSAGVPVRDDPEWLLRESGVQAVVIATPTDTHADLIHQVAEARLDVFCEKPLARTSPEARSAADACAKQDVRLAVGHVVRYFPAYAEVRRRVRAGEIGAPGMARCRRVSRPPREGSWFRDAARSGGLLFDMGVHDFDWLAWCLGPVERVSALSSQFESAPVSVVTLAHRNGTLSMVELSWADPRGFATSVEVSGPGGILRHDSRSSSTFDLQRWAEADAAVPAVEVPAGRVSKDPYWEELADALSWFRGGAAPRSQAADGVRAVALAEAARTSASRRQPVDFADFFQEEPAR
jgi:predicted dehydrogenase